MNRLKPFQTVAARRRGRPIEVRAIDGGFALGYGLPTISAADSGVVATTIVEGSLRAYVEVRDDDSITVVTSALSDALYRRRYVADLVGGELDAGRKQVKVVAFDGHVLLRGDSRPEPQDDGQPGSAAQRFDRYRRVAAIARTMLIAAAAGEWAVPALEIRAAGGMLSHHTGRRGGYGRFASRAARLPIPRAVYAKPAAVANTAIEFVIGHY